MVNIVFVNVCVCRKEGKSVIEERDSKPHLHLTLNFTIIKNNTFCPFMWLRGNVKCILSPVQMIAYLRSLRSAHTVVYCRRCVVLCCNAMCYMTYFIELYFYLFYLYENMKKWVMPSTTGKGRKLV